MKNKLLLALIPFLLGSCGASPSDTPAPNSQEINQNSNENSNNNINNDENNFSNGGQVEQKEDTDQGNDDHSNTEDSHSDNNEHHDDTNQPLNEYVPDNNPYSLEDYTEFHFHNGRTPEYDKDWDFYEKTTHNVNSFLWTNPNEKSECSGVEFKKNRFAVSPMFKSWKKVEVRFNFWFSSHESSSYKAVDGQPQFYIEQYSNIGKLLKKESINIAKSDIPKNNTAKEIKHYFDEDDCAYFILRWNNYIANGSGGYSAILCDSTLKGWNYDL